MAAKELCIALRSQGSRDRAAVKERELIHKVGKPYSWYTSLFCLDNRVPDPYLLKLPKLGNPVAAAQVKKPRKLLEFVDGVPNDKVMAWQGNLVVRGFGLGGF